jgi:transcriptional regulator with XRE-family HTH domain
MKKMNFSELLLKYMGQKNVKVKAMAEAVGVTHTTIINWRKGSKPRTRERVLACAKHLKLSMLETNDLLKATGFEPEAHPFVKNIFEELPRYRVMLLLTKADWNKSPYHDALEILKTQAKENYKNNVLCIKPPAALNANINNYFSKLGKQCKFSGVNDAESFEDALETCLEHNKKGLFLLVSRFEQGADSPREQLAEIVNNLIDEHQHFHVVLWDAEKLATLKFKTANMPLLNLAKVKYWPELTRQEVSAFYFEYLPSDLDETLVDNFLAISGGHPDLLIECLKLKKRSPDLAVEKYPEKLSKCECIYDSFTQFTQQDSVRQQVYEWLLQEDLGPNEPYIQDELLRQLYWKNLLIEREVNGEQRLVWRCEAIRMGGKQICGKKNRW